MNAISKNKLCWNCEANVSVTDENCPYCGVGVQNSLLQGYQNEFSPPYRMGKGNQTVIPESPYKDEESQQVEDVVQEEAEEASEFKIFLIAMLMMLSGSVFFLFGIVLALFSKDGVFILQWNGSYWYAYLILAVPLLFFGWNAVQRMNDI